MVFSELVHLPVAATERQRTCLFQQKKSILLEELPVVTLTWTHLAALLIGLTKQQCEVEKRGGGRMGEG